MAARTSKPSYVPIAPIGTIIPLGDGLFWVQGFTGEYLVTQHRATMSCECPRYRYHCAGTNQPCKHARWVQDWLWIKAYFEGS